MAIELSEEELLRVHPFTMWVVDQLDIRDGSPDEVFGDEDLLELAKGLEMLLGSEDLRFAVVSLLNLAGTLKKNGGPRTAKAIFDLVERPKILEGLRALNEGRDLENENNKLDGKKAFEKLTGDEKRAEPAKVGEDRPKDTVTLDGLKFPRRL